MQTMVSPAISWEPVPGVLNYRLQLTSRKPEGRTYATIDTIVTGTRFAPPQVLTDGFAAIKVTVTSQCAAGTQPAPAVAHRFYIDARPACRVAGLVVDSLSRRIEWAPTAGANGYEVCAYDALDGRLLFKLESREPRVAPPRTPEFSVVAVRARCGAILGQASYAAY